MRRGEPVAGNVALVEDWPEVGEPGLGGVRLRTVASAFNPLDLWVGRGVAGRGVAYPGGAGWCGVGGVGAAEAEKRA